MQWQNLDNSRANNNTNLLHLYTIHYFYLSIFWSIELLQDNVTLIWLEVLESVDIFSTSFSSSSLSMCCLNGSMCNNNNKESWELL